MCGLLGKSMYGTRDAAQNWGEAYMTFMTSIGFTKGIGSPCTFYHKSKDLICVVHGDDFTILGWSTQLDWFWKQVQIKFEAKHRGRIGPDRNDEKEMRILNRIVTWTDEGIDYEGDQRHVEICMANLGIVPESREVGTPIEKERGDVKEKSAAAAALAKSSAEAAAEEEWLDNSDSTRYRGLIARMNYLGQDRSDIQYTEGTEQLHGQSYSQWHEQNQAPGPVLERGAKVCDNLRIPSKSEWANCLERFGLCRL